MSRPQDLKVMKALRVIEKDGPLSLVYDCPKPVVERPDDVVIQVEYSGINPIDYVVRDSDFPNKEYPYVFGCECSGVIVDLGTDARERNFNIGDCVAAFTSIGKATGGTCAEYTKVEADRVIRIPQWMNQDVACTLGTGLMTAGVLFYHICEGKKFPKDSPVIVYGASSSVGQYVVQIAKTEGCKVYAIARKRNWPLVQRLGASECFDYTDNDWNVKLSESIGAQVKGTVIDCIGEEESLRKLTEFAKEHIKPAIVATTNPKPPQLGIEGVKVISIVLPNCPDETEITNAVRACTQIFNDWLERRMLEATSVQTIEGLEAAAKGLPGIDETMAEPVEYVVHVQEVSPPISARP